VIIDFSFLSFFSSLAISTNPHKKKGGGI